MKKIIALILLFSCIFAFIYGWFIISSTPNIFYHDTHPGFISSLLPKPIKEALKKTIFIIPTLKRQLDQQQTQHMFDMKRERERTNEIIVDIAKNISYFTIEPLSPKKIESKFNTFQIEIFPFPLPKYDLWGAKPVSYIDQTNQKIIFVTGNGLFFSFDKNDIISKKIQPSRIETNITEVIKDKDFYIPSWQERDNLISIKDLLILNNSIFVSYTKDINASTQDPDDDCYNTSILKADLSFTSLIFNEFFTYDECIEKSDSYFRSLEFNPHLSGGRMTPFKNNKILFTTGEYRKGILSQDKNSMFGKIISIDLETKEYELISIGHRNPQGLYYDVENDFVMNSEHGPRGGDEFNINLDPSNNVIENFGWPISSYGFSDEGVFREEEPLHKSHKDYGFIEPAKYFTPSVGIQQIIRVPSSMNKDFVNDFFVGSMGWDIPEGDKSIHHFRFNEKFDQIVFEDIIPIGERVREILIIKETNQILLFLESVPGIALFDIVN